jgi:hypothetical protein
MCQFVQGYHGGMDDNTALIPCNVTMSKGSDLANYGTLPCYMSNQQQDQWDYHDSTQESFSFCWWISPQIS